MNLSDHYNKVAEFHRVFEHPVGDGVTPISAVRQAVRSTWTIDEVEEFREAETIYDQVDGLMDAYYFSVGSLVETGLKVNPALNTLLALIGDALNADLRPFLQFGKPVTRADRDKICASLIESINDAMVKTDIVEQFDAHGANAVICYYLIMAMGINPDPIFEIVHNANMAKVWPDNTVHKRADGKTIKPDGWVAPEPLIEAEIKRQLGQDDSQVASAVIAA